MIWLVLHFCALGALFQDWAAQRCTISYRAPELFSVQSHCVIDERTDVWVRSMWLGTWEEQGVPLYYCGGKGGRYLVSVAWVSRTTVCVSLSVYFLPGNRH